MTSPPKQGAERLSALFSTKHPGREELLAAARRLDALHAERRWRGPERVVDVAHRPDLEERNPHHRV